MGSSVACPVDTETVSLVLDGEADAETRQSYQDHLDRCPGCARQHQFYSQLRSLVRTSCSSETCPELARARMLKALQAEVAAPKTAVVAASSLPASAKAGNWRPMAGAVAAAAAIVSIYALRPSTDDAKPLAMSLSDDHTRCCQRLPEGQSHPPNPGTLAQQTYGTKMPEMAELSQLHPYDVRLCPVTDGRQAIHVLCRDPQQRVISMYTMPRSQASGVRATQDRPAIFDTEQARVATWEHKGWVFSLVSRVPQEELATLAGQCSYGSPEKLGQPLTPLPAGLPVQAIPASHRP